LRRRLAGVPGNTYLNARGEPLEHNRCFENEMLIDKNSHMQKSVKLHYEDVHAKDPSKMVNNNQTDVIQPKDLDRIAQDLIRVTKSTNEFSPRRVSDLA